MSAEPAGRVVHAAGGMWRGGKKLPLPGSAAEIEQALADDEDAQAWMFLPRSDAAALRPASGRLGLDALAVEDLVNPREGIKAEWVNRTLVAVLPVASYDPTAAELDLRTVALVADGRLMIVLADSDLRPRLAKALSAAPLTTLGIPAAVHAVLDVSVNSCAASLRELTESVEALSEKIFQDRPFTRAEQLQAYRLRRALGRLRRTSNPLSDVCSDLANAAGRRAGQEPDPDDPAETLLGVRSSREFSDVADHAKHVAELGLALREEVASMYETNLSLADVRLNTVMKKLAGWGAIIAVPTLITGFLGMNVDYPGFGTVTGFVVAAVVLLAIPAALFLVFRRKDWL